MSIESAVNEIMQCMMKAQSLEYAPSLKAEDQKKRNAEIDELYARAASGASALLAGFLTDVHGIAVSLEMIAANTSMPPR